MEVGGQGHALTLLPGKRPGTHCTGSWVGPRAGQNRCGKSRPPPGFDPRAVQLVASRFTDYAIPAHIFLRVTLNKIIVSLVGIDFYHILCYCVT